MDTHVERDPFHPVFGNVPAGGIMNTHKYQLCTALKEVTSSLEMCGLWPESQLAF